MGLVGFFGPPFEGKMAHAVKCMHCQKYPDYKLEFSERKGFSEYATSVEEVKVGWDVSSAAPKDRILNPHPLLNIIHILLPNPSTHQSLYIRPVLPPIMLRQLFEFVFDSLYFLNKVDFFCCRGGIIVVCGH